jgi:hypothetical protein
MTDIFDEAGEYPNRLQSDNGKEFSGDLDELLDEKDIKHIRTTSYSPQSNGMIEGFNRIVRKILREIFVRNNNLKWVQYLNDVCENRNTTFVSTIKARPIDIYRSNLGTRFKKMQNDKVIKNVKANAENEIKKNKTKELEVGDYVRIQTSSLYSEVRKMIKEGNKKNVIVSYTPNIYKIKTVIRHNPKYSKNEYIVESLDGLPINKHLFANQMQKVDYNPDKQYPIVDMHKLNRMPKNNENVVNLNPNYFQNPDKNTNNNRIQTRSNVVNYEPDYWEEP